jgi:putative hydrolase of the HAD superfamily
MMKNNITCLLFDFDGTLAYREGLWTDTMMDVLRKRGITEVRKEELRPFFNIGYTWDSPDAPHDFLFKGKTWWEYYEERFREALSLVGLSVDEASVCAAAFRAEYLCLDKWIVYDDVFTTLDILRSQGYRFAIVSNHVPELDTLVAALNLAPYFEKVYTSALVGFEKPNRRIYERALAELSVSAKECVMVGDSYEADVAGALRCGMQAVLVRKNNTKDYPRYCPDFSTLPGLIETLRGKSLNSSQQGRVKS